MNWRKLHQIIISSMILIQLGCIPLVVVDTVSAHQHNQMILSRFNQGHDDLDDDLKEDGGGGSLQFAGPAETFAIAAPIVATSQLIDYQCEKIAFDFCSTMPFNLTRMPNFFNDKNQIEASERSEHYKSLVHSKCSRHLLDYLCELIAPMCLDGKDMKKFEIYPCRSFCRQVKRDCEQELSAISFSYPGLNQPLVLKAFQCDDLPFESNGGEGALHGPCHETPDTIDSSQLGGGASQTVQSASNNRRDNSPSRTSSGNYWPYESSLDNPNIPPIITDNSRIDLDLINSRRSKINSNNNNIGLSTNNNNNNRLTDEMAAGGGGGGGNTLSKQQPNLMQQIQSIGQLVATSLIKYSNLISLITLICLLIILNAKRLNRLKGLVFTQTSRSSQSSASSSSSQRKLAPSVGSAFAAAALIGGGGGGQQSAASPAKKSGHQVSLSPSSSSRSLMLFAGGVGGGAGAKHNSMGHAQHQLVSHEHQLPLNGNHHQHHQSLFQQHSLGRHNGNTGSHKPTLINVDGTFERNNQSASKYRFLQSQLAAAAAAANGARTGGDQHEYDYIQVNQGQGHEITKEQQLYKNILLSSPSHQVLLFGGDTQTNSGNNNSNNNNNNSTKNNSRRTSQQQAASPQCRAAPMDQPIGQQLHYLASSSPYASPYSATATTSSQLNNINYLQQMPLVEHQQRSFNRRNSSSSSSATAAAQMAAAAITTANNNNNNSNNNTTASKQQRGSSSTRRHAYSGASSASTSSVSSSSFSPPSLANNTNNGGGGNNLTTSQHLIASSSTRRNI